jgi:transposase
LTNAASSRGTAGIIVGIDTHKDEHVAVAIDRLGMRLGQRYVSTTGVGYANLECWASNLGKVEVFGIEGTGSYGAALSRFLQHQGYRVIEVNRPDRSIRRRLGKSDPTDAEAAARSILVALLGQCLNQAWLR